MFAPLFAVRGSWIGILLLLLGAGFVIWFIVRVIRDLITWVKEEIIDEIRWKREKAAREDRHEWKKDKQ